MHKKWMTSLAVAALLALSAAAFADDVDGSEAYVATLRLAEQGIASAQSNLGVMYNNGQGVPQDDKAALKWYSLAAEQGRADALRGRPFNSSGMDRDEIRINAAT